MEVYLRARCLSAGGRLAICRLDVCLQLTIHLQAGCLSAVIYPSAGWKCLQLSIRMLDVHLQLTIHLQLSIRMLDDHLIEELRSSASRILLPFGGGFEFLSLLLGTEKTYVEGLDCWCGSLMWLDSGS